MIQLITTIAENVQLAERTFRIRLHCPELAAKIRPGQFVMLRIPGTTDPLLARPFALYDNVLEGDTPFGIDVVYLVVGKMTLQLSQMVANESLTMWGPLGNGFPEPEEKSVVCVAGGIGQTPFLAYARWLLGSRGYGGESARNRCDNVSLYYGVRSKALTAGGEDFQAAGVHVHIASDDGSIGYHGFVTQLLATENPNGLLVGCGPEPMLKALAAYAESNKRRCLVSLETPMACGFGVCFSCVTNVLCESGWDYKRVCVDGPVFDAGRLKWD